MSSHLNDVYLCIPSCLMSAFIFYDVSLPVLRLASCKMSACLNYVCLLVLCLLTWMMLAFLYDVYLPERCYLRLFGELFNGTSHNKCVTKQYFLKRYMSHNRTVSKQYIMYMSPNICICDKTYFLQNSSTKFL
jgi:hypothetical protein